MSVIRAYEHATKRVPVAWSAVNLKRGRTGPHREDLGLVRLHLTRYHHLVVAHSAAGTNLLPSRFIGRLSFPKRFALAVRAPNVIANPQERQAIQESGPRSHPP